MKKISLKIKKFIAYIVVCFSKAGAEAVNAATSEEELDEFVLQKAGFRK